jgi:Icc-related predicted phosphoesterase
MFANYTSSDVYVYGDIHGAFNINDTLGNDIKSVPRGAIIIQLGDFGLGFRSKEVDESTLYDLNDLLSSRNIKLFAIRGNHDSPQLFKEYNSTRFSNITFLNDYTYLTINSHVYGFVGGAVSVDRQRRTPGKDYWVDENFVLDINRTQKCDVLCTHNAPLYVGPNIRSNIRYYLDTDKTLWEILMKEREDIKELIKLSNPKLHYCGHHHCNDSVHQFGCLSRIVDIEEILLVNEYRL